LGDGTQPTDLGTASQNQLAIGFGFDAISYQKRSHVVIINLLAGTQGRRRLQPLPGAISRRRWRRWLRFWLGMGGHCQQRHRQTLDSPPPPKHEGTVLVE